MQVVPPRLAALGIGLILCASALAFGLPGPEAAAAEELQMSAAFVRRAPDEAELQISWRWNLSGTRVHGEREHLLAVTFDTRQVVFLGDEALEGRGATGLLLKRLEGRVGPDGARRLYVVPEGRDGRVSVRFRSPYPGRSAAGAAIRVHLVLDGATGESGFREIDLTYP